MTVTEHRKHVRTGQNILFHAEKTSDAARYVTAVRLAAAS
jgi:hypothetical protein